MSNRNHLSAFPSLAGGELTIRASGDADRATLRRLAQLDSTPLPRGPFLVAEVAGRALAAYSLSARRVIADPFQPTADLAALLEIRARQLDGRPEPADAVPVDEAPGDPMYLHSGVALNAQVR
jgi:hypothetical protein